MARQCLLFCSDVSPLGHFLPKEAHLVAVKHFLWQISPRVDEALKPRNVLVGGRDIRVRSLAVTDNAVDPRSILEFLQPAFAGLEGRSSLSVDVLGKIGIQLPRLLADDRLVDGIALHLVFVYPYEKQLFPHRQL